MRSWGLRFLVSVLAFVSIPPCFAQTLDSVTILPGTSFHAYQNRPHWRAGIGYEWAFFSPRAVAEADSLRATGTNVGVWLQPWVCVWRGAWFRGTRFDDALVYLATEKYDAVLRDSTGALAGVDEGDISGCFALDFRVPGFAGDLAESVNALGADGVYLDYGTCDISWIVPLRDVPRDVWPAWREGYSRYKRALGGRVIGGVRDACRDDVDGASMEGVPWIYSYRRALDTMTPPNTGLLFCQVGSGARRERRVLAAISLLTGALFNWRDFTAAGIPNLRAPEFFDLEMGPPAGRLEEGRYWWEYPAGIIRGRTLYGLVILNLSGQPYRYGSRTIAAADALVAQVKDPATGRFIKWRTTEGR